MLFFNYRKNPFREKLMEIYTRRNKSFDHYISQQNRKLKFLRWLKRTLLALVALFICIVLFLKLDTKGAAELTDNILRPLLGDDRVLYLEKIFFNASDQVQRWTSNPNSVKAPQFNDQGSKNNIAGGNLNLNPLAPLSNFQPLAGEGVWQDRPLSLFPGKEVIAETFLRTDPERSYSITTIVQMDLSVMNMGSVAGIKQPGGPVGKPGPGVVPKDIINSGNLIVAFDGGFQYRDGAYGMIVGDTTYLPLKSDLGTLVGYKDGSLKIINYTGQDLGGNIAFVRQNCPILIEDGNVSVSDPKNKALWGRLAKGTTGIYTWRSGIGLTKEGNLLFAAGNNLTPDTLAVALKSAGAVNAIQLDINPIWVRFNIFDPSGQGKYTSVTLTKELQDGSRDYLNGYAKDFFYIYKK